MFIKVYDTHIRTKSGRHLHFDVLTDQDIEAAQKYANKFITERGLLDEEIFLNRCQYCHSEQAKPKIAAAIKTQGYYIAAVLDYQG